MLENNTIKHINKLQQKKYRKEYQEFIIEGIKGIQEALDSDSEISILIIEGNKREDKGFEDIIKKAQSKDIHVEFCTTVDIKKIKTTDTFPGILAVVSQDDYSLDDILNDSIICLDGIKDPGNMGTIIRTMDWFGINSIVLSEDCVDPYNEKVVRSSMGSIFRAKIFQSNDLITTLGNLKKKNEYSLTGLVMKGDSITKLSRKEKTVYIFGSESHGISEDIEKILDKKYTIPGTGKAESLNVGVSVGILLNQIFK